MRLDLVAEQVGPGRVHPQPLLHGAVQSGHPSDGSPHTCALARLQKLSAE